MTITSLTVKQPVDGLILSNSVRAAVAGLVKSLANEYGAHNVLVNNVCPGYTATDRLGDLSNTLAKSAGLAPTEIEKRWTTLIPLGRLAHPKEFAACRGVSRVGTGELHHRAVDRHRWRIRAGSLIATDSRRFTRI